jgi:hypothetical protein
MLRNTNQRQPERQSATSQMNRTFEGMAGAKSQSRQARIPSPKSIVIKPIDSVFLKQPCNKPTLSNTSFLGDVGYRPSCIRRPQTVRTLVEDPEGPGLRKGLFQMELEKSNKENIPANGAWKLGEPHCLKAGKPAADRKDRSLNKLQGKHIIIINKKEPARVREPTEESLLLSLTAEDLVRISEASGQEELLDMSPYFQ